MLSNSQLVFRFLDFLNKLYMNKNCAGHILGSFFCLVFFCSLLFKPFFGPLTFVTLHSYSLWLSRVSQLQKCQLTSVMVISATMVSGADGTEAQKRSSENGKRRALFCALNIQCSTRYSQGKVGKEWTLKGPGNHLEHKRQRIHTCLGHRVLLWNVGYCLLYSTHCLCSSFLHCLAPHSLLLSNSLWLNSHNVKVLECTQRPQKEVESCVRQEGDPGLWGDFHLAPKMSLAGSSHIRAPRTHVLQLLHPLFSNN